jgi:hypothetical protein
MYKNLFSVNEIIIILDTTFTNENDEKFQPFFTLEGAQEDVTFINMMEEVKALKSPFFTMFRKETCIGVKIIQLLKGMDLRPILIASLIKLMREESIAEILKGEKNLAKKNTGFINYWLKLSNLMAMQIISQIRDNNGNSYKDNEFLLNQEIQPAIMELDSLIKQSLEKTYKMLYNKDKIIEYCGWSNAEAEGILIFDTRIFNDRSDEAKLIWSELSANILYHVTGMVDNPKTWALDYRFWMNSEIFCEALGLELFDKNGIKNPIGSEFKIDLSITQLVEAEMDKDTVEKFLAKSCAQKMIKNIITGNLPVRSETDKSKETLEIEGMELMEEIVLTSEDQVSAFMKLAVIKLKDRIQFIPSKSEFLINEERMSPDIMNDILKELKINDDAKKLVSIENSNLSNSEWVKVLDIAGSGDTLDCKNIITLWNTINLENEVNLDLLADNINQIESTCDYFYYKRGHKMVCNNITNNGEQNCSLHKALKANNVTYNKNQSLFPVVFGSFVFYVEAELPDSNSLFAPKTYQISRVLATDQHKRAHGKKFINYHENCTIKSIRT